MSKRITVASKSYGFLFFNKTGMHNIRNQTTKNRHTRDRLEQIHRTHSALNNKTLPLEKEGTDYLGLQNNTYLLRHSFERREKIKHKELTPSQEHKI